MTTDSDRTNVYKTAGSDVERTAFYLDGIDLLWSLGIKPWPEQRGAQ